MKIELSYNKPAQFFFYLYHLSEWHFSSIKEVVDQWVKQTGVLSKKEQSALRQAKRIFRRHPFGDRYLGTAFIEKKENETFQELKRVMSVKDYEILAGIFEILNDRFEQLWKSDKLKLSIFAKTLSVAIADKKFSALIKKTECVFGKLPIILTVKLLSLPKESQHMGGSANTPGDTVTIEIRDTHDCIPSLFVVLHELTHKLVRNMGLSFKTRKKVRAEILETIPFFKNMFKEEALEELFLIFFLPNGYLAKEFYKNIHLEKNFAALPDELHAYMKGVISGGKLVDRNTIRTFTNFLLQKK